MTKRKLLAVIATSTALLASSPVAQAATNFYPSHILLNGKQVTSADHIVANDPSSHQPTSWIPIYYLEATLKDIGVTSTWSGTVWNLNVPASFNPDVSNPTSQSVSSSEMAIAINGVKVVIAPKLAAPDPSGGAETTYAPIYYVEVTLKRLGITPSWDGTNWTMTSSVNAGVTQTTMASALWNVFDATTWDVNTHPTEQQAGVTPTSGTVTAGDVATWLADWAGKAKGYTAAAYNPKNTNPPQSFVPYSLQYESSTNPFTWAQENDLYQGTSVTSASSVITPNEVSQITGNLKWWLNGYKVVNGVYHLHVPMYGNYNSWTVEIQGHVLTEQQYQLALSDAQHYYDEVTVTPSGNYLDMTLPNTKGSASEMSWGLNDGSFSWGYAGGPSQAGDYGGITVKVPNTGPGIVLTTNSFKANNMGYNIVVYVKSTSSWYPYDGGNGQSVN